MLKQNLFAQKESLVLTDEILVLKSFWAGS